jgi:hypothetical protein
MLRGLLVLTVAALAASAATAADPLITKVYPVADLVVTPPDQSALKLPPLGQFRQMPPPLVQAVSGVHQASATEPAPEPIPTVRGDRSQADKLMKLIKGMVRPYTWKEHGGPGQMDYYEIGGVLAVSQTAEVHAEIADLLRANRLMIERMPQVSLEVRVIEVPKTLFEQIHTDYPSCCEKSACKQEAPCLCAKQVQELLAAVQADARANVMMAPKMTTRTGRQMVVSIEDRQTFQTGLDLSAGPEGVVRKPRYEVVSVGTRIAATPTVSADRHAVKLKFRYESAKLSKAAAVVPVSVGDASRTEKPADLLARPAVERQEIERELTIPAGKTALLVGPCSVREERIECGTPVRSSIAQVSRLFHKVVTRHVSCRQLILVTPRVLTTAESQQALAPPPRVRTTEECPKAQAAKLVAAYRKACADGRTEEAMKCAMQALAKDPHCFAEQK